METAEGEAEKSKDEKAVEEKTESQEAEEQDQQDQESDDDSSEASIPTGEEDESNLEDYDGSEFEHPIITRSKRQITLTKTKGTKRLNKEISQPTGSPAVVTTRAATRTTTGQRKYLPSMMHVRQHQPI
eukprot:GHVU01216687.1.p1 GENE.GHVU01216687.1~~GHVU01216687.1.p1  ORF type:complete len:129 (+),score=32.78 GHVU01216687.1:154-540(+)